jgi:hypothetical protein
MMMMMMMMMIIIIMTNDVKTSTADLFCDE